MASKQLDLLVIGGGITGAGAALDAASRGLSVGLIEKADLASGTSSRSSKLIHGGIRYLEQGDIALVREALRERELLLTRTAPHLVRPVPFLMPLRHRAWERAYLGAGVALYDRLGGARSVPAGKHLSRRAARRAAPSLRQEGLVGGIVFWDAQTDDARCVLAVARTAAACGAHIATRTAATSLLIEDGVVRGAHVVDTETGQRRTLRARHVISAVGAWTGDLLEELGTESAVRPSKGVHLLLEKSALDLEHGVISRTASGLLFIIPWEGAWLIGDTDTEWTGDNGAPVAERDDVATLLERLATVLRTPVRVEQILGAFAGIRPLVAADPEAKTVSLSREHAIDAPRPGLSVITGGKFTTYRSMAEQVVDAAVETSGLATAGPSVTADLPLLGAAGFAAHWSDRASLAAEHGMDLHQIERLLHRYGDRFAEVTDLIAQDPSLGAPVADDVLAAEVVHACRYEGARHLDDVLLRRTRLALRTRAGGIVAAPEIADLMRRSLAWDDETTTEELQYYRQTAARETAALPAPAAPPSAGLRHGAPAP